MAARITGQLEPARNGSRKTKRKHQQMLLGYKKEFAPYVIDGSKPHTARNPRKVMPKVGDRAFEYTGLRTNNCQLLRKDRLIQHIAEITIFKSATGPGLPELIIDGVLLPEAALRYFIWLDGFRDDNKPDYARFLKHFGFLTNQSIWLKKGTWTGNLYHFNEFRYTPELDYVQLLTDLKQINLFDSVLPY